MKNCLHQIQIGNGLIWNEEEMISLDGFEVIKGQYIKDVLYYTPYCVPMRAITELMSPKAGGKNILCQEIRDQLNQEW